MPGQRPQDVLRIFPLSVSSSGLCVCNQSSKARLSDGSDFLTACLIAVFLRVLIKARTLHSSNRHYMHLLQVIRFREKKKKSHNSNNNHNSDGNFF